MTLVDRQKKYFYLYETSSAHRRGFANPFLKDIYYAHFRAYAQVIVKGRCKLDPTHLLLLGQML